MYKPKKSFTVFLLTVSALSISVSAAFFSVYGLSKVFAGAATEVIIMGSILEASKLITAYAIHQNADKLPVLLRRYLTGAVIVLMIITSAGIYGFLSNAYQITATKNSVVENQIKIVEAKITSQQERLTNFLKEKETISQDLNSLRSGMSTNTTVQYVDRKTGNVVRSTAEGIRKSLDAQLQDATVRRNKVEENIDILSANIDSMKIDIMNMQLGNDAAAELGPLIYLSKISNYPMDKLMNYFILLIVFVFDPLAICLVLALSYISKIDSQTINSENIVRTSSNSSDKEENVLDFFTTPEQAPRYSNDLEFSRTSDSDLEPEKDSPSDELFIYSDNEDRREDEENSKLPKLTIKTIKKQVPEYKIVDNGQKVFTTKEVEEVIIEPGDEEGNTVSLSPDEYKKLLEKYISQLQQSKSLPN